MNGIFFQGHLYKDKIGAPALDWAKEILVKYLTEDELPKEGDPTHFYYFGMINGIGVVEGFRRAGRDLTRESYLAAIESLRDFDTNLAAGMVTITDDQHVGMSDMFFNGLDDDGNEVICHRVRQAAPLTGGGHEETDEAGGRRAWAAPASRTALSSRACRPARAPLSSRPSGGVQACCHCCPSSW